MSDLKSKQEYVLEKSVIESQIELLKTKEGADTFIATEVKKIDDVIKTVPVSTATRPDRLSMSELLAIEKEKLEKFPEQCIEKEMACLECAKTDIELVVTEIEKDIEVINEPIKR